MCACSGVLLEQAKLLATNGHDELGIKATQHPTGKSNSSALHHPTQPHSLFYPMHSHYSPFHPSLLTFLTLRPFRSPTPPFFFPSPPSTLPIYLLLLYHPHSLLSFHQACGWLHTSASLVSPPLLSSPAFYPRNKRYSADIVHLTSLAHSLPPSYMKQS